MKLTVGRIVFTLIFILIFPVLLLFLSGDWFWVEGWIFSLWFTGLCFTTIIYLYIRIPPYLRKGIKDREPPTKKMGPGYCLRPSNRIYSLDSFYASRCQNDLDGLPIFSLWLKIFGGIGLLLSSLLFFRSYADNYFRIAFGQNTERSESSKSFRQESMAL